MFTGAARAESTLFFRRFECNLRHPFVHPLSVDNLPANRMIKLKPGVFERLPAPEIGGIPFVCVVDGARLFSRVFWSEYFSQNPGANAMILLAPVPVDYVVLDCWGQDEPNSTALRVELPWERHIPKRPWSDSRLRNCLEKLHKFNQVQ
jgi:hypothetical protein